MSLSPVLASGREVWAEAEEIQPLQPLCHCPPHPLIASTFFINIDSYCTVCCRKATSEDTDSRVCLFIYLGLLTTSKSCILLVRSEFSCWNLKLHLTLHLVLDTGRDGTGYSSSRPVPNVTGRDETPSRPGSG
jgi:hypothetical protein